MHDCIQWVSVPRHGRLPTLQQAPAVSPQHDVVMDNKNSMFKASQVRLDTSIDTALPACDAHW